VDRVQKLEARLLAALDAGETISTAAAVEIMIDAGTTDLRGQEIVSVALDVVGDTGDLSEFEQATVALMRDWVSNGTRGLGAMRRDREGPGQNTSGLEYEDRPAVVFMDLWWDRMIDALLPQITAVEAFMVGGRHDLPNRIGSAFNGGYYGYVHRVLQMALEQSANPYQVLRCAGTGTLAGCRAALVESIRATIAELGEDMAQWDGTDNARGSNAGETREQDDAIGFDSIGVAGVPNIHWQNRPTYQQVVQPQQRRE
jgi:hypothetical protein